MGKVFVGKLVQWDDFTTDVSWENVCLAIRKTLPILVATLQLYGGLNHIITPSVCCFFFFAFQQRHAEIRYFVYYHSSLERSYKNR